MAHDAPLTKALMGGAGASFADHLPYLCSLATALAPESAEDLVQDTLAAALATGGADATRAELARSLARRAGVVPVAFEAPVTPVPGDDPDADEPELFYPGFYADGPDAGAWTDAPVAWGVAQVVHPEAALAAIETGGVVDDALEALDPVERALVTMVDIESVPLRTVARDLDLPFGAAHARLASARSEVRAALDRHLRP